MDINHVVVIGNLTRDAELKYTNGGCAICNMSIAVNERIKKGDEWTDKANFFDVVLFGKTGESLNQYLTKGTKIGVSGHLESDQWEADGQKRHKVYIKAEEIELLGGKHDAKQTVNKHPDGQDVPVNPPKTVPANDDFTDDIPF